jgi:hypothetical protein
MLASEVVAGEKKGVNGRLLKPRTHAANATNTERWSDLEG